MRYKKGKIRKQEKEEQEGGKNTVCAVHAFPTQNSSFFLFIPNHTAVLHAKSVEIASALESVSDNPWVSLILAFMFEYNKGAKSHWHAYFRVLPPLDKLRHPHFWPKEHREYLLSGTHLCEDVEEDLANMKKEYEEIALPFMQQHPDLYDLSGQYIYLFLYTIFFSLSQPIFVFVPSHFKPFQFARWICIPAWPQLSWPTGKLHFPHISFFFSFLFFF